MAQVQNDDLSPRSEAEMLRHEVMALVAILAHDQLLDSEARDRARRELASALDRLAKLILSPE